MEGSYLRFIDLCITQLWAREKEKRRRREGEEGGALPSVLGTYEIVKARAPKCSTASAPRSQ